MDIPSWVGIIIVVVLALVLRKAFKVAKSIVVLAVCLGLAFLICSKYGII